MTRPLANVVFELEEKLQIRTRGMSRLRTASTLVDWKRWCEKAVLVASETLKENGE